MTVTASLISGASKSVQLVVSGVPEGVGWSLEGRVASVSPGLEAAPDLSASVDLVPADAEIVPGDYSWRVPGGFGVGTGGQVVLVDNRSPGNTSLVYSLVREDGEERSNPVVVPFETDFVLQSLDGQRSLAVELLDGSLDDEYEPNVALFQVPGRARPVVRYDTTGDVRASFRVLVDASDSRRFRELIASGEPLVYRSGPQIFDLDPVGAVALTAVSSKAYPTGEFREWSLGYALVDDPFADVRLGAFTWDAVEAGFAGRPWSDFDQAFAGLDWDRFDTAEWAVV